MTIYRRSIAAAGIALGLALSPLHDAWSQTTLRMWTFLNPGGQAPREKALKILIDRFEAANAGTKVQVEQQVWDQMTPKFFAAHGAGNAPDVIWVVMDQYPQAVQIGALANLHDLFIKNWPKEQVDAINDTYWQFGGYGAGKHYMIAHSRNLLGIMYREDFLREGGIEPSSIRTWDAMIDAAKKLTKRNDKGEVTRWGLGLQFGADKADPSPVLNFIYAKHGRLFADNCKAQWANDAGVEAMTKIASYVKDAKITPEAAINYSVEDLYDQMAAGRIAIMSAASVRMPQMQGAINQRDIKFMPFPGTDPGTPLAASGTGWAVGVWAKSRNLAMAGKWLEFMSSPEADKVWAEVGQQVPLYSSTVKAMPEFFAEPKNQFLAAASGGFKTAWMSPKNCAIGGIREDVNTATQHVVLGRKTPLEALKEAEAKFNQRHGY